MRLPARQRGRPAAGGAGRHCVTGLGPPQCVARSAVLPPFQRPRRRCRRRSSTRVDGRHQPCGRLRDASRRAGLCWCSLWLRLQPGGRARHPRPAAVPAARRRRGGPPEWRCFSWPGRAHGGCRPGCCSPPRCFVYHEASSCHASWVCHFSCCPAGWPHAAVPHISGVPSLHGRGTPPATLAGPGACRLTRHAASAACLERCAGTVDAGAVRHGGGHARPPAL